MQPSPLQSTPEAKPLDPHSQTAQPDLGLSTPSDLLGANVENEPPSSSNTVDPDDGAHKAPPPDHLAHRDRLRAKLDRRGADAFEDYELLELLLFQVIPRVDVRPRAKRLIKRFGTLAEVVASPVEKLTKVDGIGPAAARPPQAAAIR